MKLESMIRILCREIEIGFESNEWVLSSVYGIPEQTKTVSKDKNTTTNVFFKVFVSFPSDINEYGNDKSGIIILKLKPKHGINITNILSHLIANPSKNMFKIKV